MALPYNPWEHPKETGALPGDIATFALNGESDPTEDSPEDGAEDLAEGEAEGNPMADALEVIMQQSSTIQQLLAMLSSGGNS